jgi:hypothetical protein
MCWRENLGRQPHVLAPAMWRDREVSAESRPARRPKLLHMAVARDRKRADSNL